MGYTGSSLEAYHHVGGLERVEGCFQSITWSIAIRTLRVIFVDKVDCCFRLFSSDSTGGQEGLICDLVFFLLETIRGSEIVRSEFEKIRGTMLEFYPPLPGSLGRQGESGPPTMASAAPPMPFRPANDNNNAGNLREIFTPVSFRLLFEKC